MKHQKIEPLSQTTALRVKHAELLSDIELVAQRANAARKAPQEAAADIVEAAEAALIRLSAARRAARGGNEANAFFDPLSVRLRRIIRVYRKFDGAAAPAPVEDGKRWVYQIVNFEQLPFHRLKPFFRASHVDEAIKTAVLLGLRDLPGVRIYPYEEPDD